MIVIDPLLGLLFNCNGMQHLKELMHLHPGGLRAFALAGDALAEKGMVPTGKRIDLASSENAFAPTGITGGFDRNLLHISLHKQKIPPFLAG